MAEFSELLATYAGLGTHDGDTYFRGDECLACVKDLIRALRNDDSRCEIRRQLGQAGILQKDLLPILVSSLDNPILRSDVIRLLVNLTQPAYLCFGGSYPKNKESDLMKCFLEVNRYLRVYKESFTREDVMNTLGTVLADLCQKDVDDRDDDDVIVIERILLLVRNVLHVSPEAEEEKRTEDDVSVHDQIIWNLHINGIDELLLFLGSNQSETQWCMHVLEILFLMLREQSPGMLAKTSQGRSQSEVMKDEALVDEALAAERARKQKSQRLCGSRHPSFGGTFVIKNQKSISGGNRVYHRRLAGVDEFSYDIDKRPRRQHKKHRPTRDVPSERRSTYSIRTVLKNVCVQFLECCYNPLMKVAKNNIMHQRAMDNDETYYLWGLRFFMEFSRSHDFRVDIVGETLQLSTLHYVIQLMANYFESMVIEKKSLSDARQWAQRFHYAVQAYKELLLYIQQMSLSHSERENGRVIQSNVFYHPEYRDILVTPLRNYYEAFQSMECLRDLVECTHIYIKMMEKYCSENKHLVVRKTKKKAKKKGKKAKASSKLLNESQLIDLWERIDARVCELCEGCEPLPDSLVPFDSASNIPVDEQKIDTMGRVKMLLIDAEYPEAIALIRAAREVWPGDVFGNHGVSVDDEMEVVRSILMNPSAVLPTSRLFNEDSTGSEEEREERGEAEEVVTVETEFDIDSYIQRFTNNKIIHSYCLVLKEFRKNSDTINHAIVKMLYRIAVKLDMAPLLFQISVFRTLQAILQEPITPRFKELQKFSRYIVAGFFRMTSKNPLMFVELLFWKTSHDCHELTAGYGTRDREREMLQLSKVWTREQEEELKELFQRYKDEEDIVACIEAGLSDGIPRSRKQIARQLVTQGLVASRKVLNQKQSKPKKGVWSEEELTHLREVFEGEGSVRSVLGLFPGRGIRDVSAQLTMMGLLTDTDKKRKPSRLNEVLIDTSESEPEEQQMVTRVSCNKIQESLDYGLSSAAKVVSELHSMGFGDQLAWLEAYISDEARDRRIDDEWEEMCVVPVSESVAKALRTDEFQQLLSFLKLQPPSQQEVFWRIPSSMSPQELEDAVRIMRKAVLDSSEAESEVEGESTLSDHEMPQSKNLKASMKSRGNHVRDESVYGDSSRPQVKKPRLTRSDSFFDSDSDGETLNDSRGNTHIATSSVSRAKTKRTTFDSPKRKRVRQFNDSSESEDEHHPRAQEKDIVEESSHTHSKQVKKSRKLMLDSDSDSDDNRLIIDLEHSKEAFDKHLINSPPANTLDISDSLRSEVVSIGEMATPGSMGILAMSQ